MSTLGVLSRAIYAKLQTNSYGAGVFVEEVTDPLNQLIVGTPRLELEIVKADSDRYVNQREMQWDAGFLITGYLKKELTDGKSNWTIDDKAAILDFGMNTSALVYSLLDDKQAGTLICPNFIMFSGQMEVFVDFEVFPGVSMFSLIVTPVIKQGDTVE